MHNIHHGVLNGTVIGELLSVIEDSIWALMHLTDFNCTLAIVRYSDKEREGILYSKSLGASAQKKVLCNFDCKDFLFTVLVWIGTGVLCVITLGI